MGSKGMRVAVLFHARERWVDPAAHTVCKGEVILLDANKTTGSSTSLEPATLHADRRRQADGIHSYLAGLKPL